MPGKYAEYLENEVFEQAMRGDKEMQVRLLAVAGGIRSNGIRREDPETWNLMLTALINAGMPEAHLKLSWLYLEGDPAFGSDPEKALYHLTMAASLGHVSTMGQLGAEYEGRKQGCSGATGGYPIKIDFDEAK